MKKKEKKMKQRLQQLHIREILLANPSRDFDIFIVCTGVNNSRLVQC